MKLRTCIVCILLFKLSVIPVLYAQKVYTIDTSRRYQSISNFGASDCWTAQFFGHFPDAKRNQMADWLFSMEMDSKGQPKGIGLSLWRFNIGSGSAEQGKNSYIPHVTRRSECFQLPDGTYDWTKQSGQRWFLQAAKQRGVEQFLAFNLSAPPQMSMNGLANNRFRPKDGTFNIKPDKYEDFADFLVTVMDTLERMDGIKFQYLSPFNEPEWDWDGQTTQEGTPTLMSDIAKTVRLLDRKMTEKKLNAQILVTESGCIDYMYRAGTDKKGRDDQIETFFHPESENYIANLAHVPSLVVGHSYWTGAPNDSLYAKRKALKNKLDKYDLGYWQTELCIMKNDTEIGGGGKRDLSMNTALYIARIIHYDLCIAGASAWQWWLGMTNSNYKDGLVYVTPNQSLTDGEITDSKLMWSLGNFSRFVRPGAKRINVFSPKYNVDDPTGLMVSSYIHDDNKSLVIVVVNYSNQPQGVKFNVKNMKVNKFIPYITSDQKNDNLRPDGEHDLRRAYKVPARSVVTFVGKL